MILEEPHPFVVVKNGAPARKDIYFDSSESMDMDCENPLGDYSSSSDISFDAPRRVHFCPTVIAVSVESTRDMSKVEKADIWYSQREYKSFKREASMIVRLLKSKPASFTEDALTTARGLEHLHGIGLSDRNSAKAAAFETVLLNQEISSSCSTLIATTYGIVSMPSRVQARQRGLCDQRTARIQ